MFEINDVKDYIKCKRLFYINTKEESSYYFSQLRNNEDSFALLKNYFSITRCYIGKENDKNKDLLSNFNNYEWFFECYINMGSLRIKIPLLQKVLNNKINLYYPIFLTNPSATNPIYYNQIFQAVKNLGFNINKVFIINLNPNYIRKNEIITKELFEVSEFFYTSNHKTNEKVIKWIKEHNRDYSKIIKAMQNTLDTNIPDKIELKKCLKRYNCRFIDQCHPDYQQRENKSIQKPVLELAKKQAKLNNGLFVKKIELNNWLNQLEYPLAFLDFEWETYSIPPYKNMKCIDALPFQYSLDILNSNHHLEHKEFLGIKDARLQLLIKLVNDLPTTGSIVVFNAKGGEKLRLLDLKRQFPHLAYFIDSIIERIVDISLPFNNGYIYHQKMRGHYSVKSIVQAISQLDYEKLNVSSGLQVIEVYAQYQKTLAPNLKNDLLKYCSYDTYSLVLIYKYLLEVAK
ncbi:MAG: DUF2779 domain-containing protein [Erysipelotrichaceae bacterium]